MLGLLDKFLFFINYYQECNCIESGTRTRIWKGEIWINCKNFEDIKILLLHTLNNNNV